MTGDPFWQAITAAGLDVSAPVAALHLAKGRCEFEGRCDIAASDGRLAGWSLRLAGFPPSGLDVPLSLICEDDGDSRVWVRDFGGHITRSVMRFDAARGAVIERFGPFKLALGLSARDGRLHVRVDGMWAFGLPVPGPLRPRSSTVEFADEAGRFAFDVAASLPFLGPIIRYRGWLQPA